MRNRTIAAVLGATATAVALTAGALPAQAASGSVVHGMSARHAASPSATSSGPLAYKGGSVVTAPSIYIVYWGSQWGTSSITNDPSGEAALQSGFFSHAYGSGDTFFTSQTQYCQGVAVGTTNCNGAGTAVGHPASNPLAGTWLDSASSAPKSPSNNQIAAEAVRAAAHFGISGNNVQVIVDLPTGVSPSGFKTRYCAWHNYTTTSTGADLPYTNFPYITDAGSSCGANFVATGSTGVSGATEGVTIVGGHEYAETLTDPDPSSGWVDSSGAETGDKCAWISSGQGASTIIALNGQNYAVQSLWSNNFSNNTGGCVTQYTSPTSQS